MKRKIRLSFTMIALAAAMGFFAQGCARSGDENPASSDSEPEFTIIGEAL